MTEPLFDQYKPHTKDGFMLDEVVSALQKEIRRGNEQNALYWALQMFPNYAMYCWRRLLVISVEDIENPEACSVVYPMYEAFNVLNNKKKAEDFGNFLFIVKAVLYLCRQPKSRESDHAFFYVNELMNKKQMPEVPEYAKDVHTQTGRLMGKTKKQFIQDEQEALNDKGRDDYFNQLSDNQNGN